ncbi:MAG: hypothetical protein NVSMB32_18230 [Actinomycetota bacterium]
MMGTLTYQTFAGRLEETFEIDLAGQPLPGAPAGGTGLSVQVRLAEVSLGGGSARADGGPSFSLVFRGPGAPILAQRTYQVRHEQLGAFQLFLVPLAPDARGSRYEAVFN